MAKLHKWNDGLYWSGMPSQEDFLRYGVDLSRTAVLDVAKKRTAQSVIDVALDYRHLPIPDGQTYRRVLFEDAAQWVQYHLGEENIVLVHCLYGKNRSATVVALTSVRRHRFPASFALSVVRRIRPGAIDNPVLEEGLLTS